MDWSLVEILFLNNIAFLTTRDHPRAFLSFAVTFWPITLKPLTC